MSTAPDRPAVVAGANGEIGDADAPPPG